MAEDGLAEGARTAAAAGICGAAALALGAPGWAGVLAGALGAGAALRLGLTAPGGARDRAGEPAAHPPEEPAASQIEPLLEALPVGVILVEADGQVPLMTAPAVEILGRRPPGRFHVSLLRTPRLLETVEACLADAVPGRVEFTHSRGGERHVRAHVCPLATAGPRLADGATPAILVMLEDLTRIRRAEELHRDFVANASHELKTPLSSISGIIETLQGHAKDDPDATERFLSIMSAQAERMRYLVNDLLSLNRIELNERIHPREPQLLAHVVGEVVEAMTPIAAGAGARLVTDTPEPTLHVRGSFEELGQALRNLIDNAIKYGPAGTTIELRLLRDTEAHPGMIGLAVIDDGPGIAREHLPRLTERFYRVSVSRSRARGGTGLGLAIVKHVVNRHRGRLDIASEPGRGSRFTMWLPLIEDPSGAPGASRHESVTYRS